jgi:DNA-binding LytR/AlgR family response regulator
MAHSTSTSLATSTRPYNSTTLKLYIRETGRKNYPVENLVYLQGVTNYSWLNWVDGQRMLMPRTLKFYSPKLPADLFIRLHRNCIVNRRFITELQRTDTGGIVHLSTGEVLPISRRRWTAVKAELGKLSE